MSRLLIEVVEDNERYRSKPGRLHVQGYGDEKCQEKADPGRKVSETWLVLEFCSQGSLQDALDRCCPPTPLTQFLHKMQSKSTLGRPPQAN